MHTGRIFNESVWFGYFPAFPSCRCSRKLGLASITKDAHYLLEVGHVYPSFPGRLPPGV